MRVIALIYCLVIEYFAWPMALGSLVSSPMNTVAVVGETIQLNCSTDERYSVNWQHVPIDSTFYEEVYISRIVVLPYYPSFKVNRNEIGNNVSEYNLVISSVQLNDAGKYRCLDMAGHGQQRSAQLTVLESPPICRTNIQPEGFVGDYDCDEDPKKIHCSCRVDYLGNIPPEMQWRSSSGYLIDATLPLTTSTKTFVSSELLLNAVSALSGTSLAFGSVGSSHINWTSSEIKILCNDNSEEEKPMTILAIALWLLGLILTHLLVVYFFLIYEESKCLRLIQELPKRGECSAYKHSVATFERPERSDIIIKVLKEHLRS